MASQTSIDVVKDNLPTWAVEIAGWDDTKIIEILDKVEDNAVKTVRLFWLQRVSDTAAFTDVADAGSNRPLSQTYQHAREMLDYWDKLAGVVGGTKIGTIKRRYPKPVGNVVPLSDYGGVYARTD